MVRSRLYGIRSFSTARDRPTNAKPVAEVTNVASILGGGKYSTKEIESDGNDGMRDRVDYLLWSGRMVFNHPRTFHKRRTDQHAWLEKAVEFGVI